MASKPVTLTSAFLGALLAFGNPDWDARASTAPAAAQDSGTLQRADADMRRAVEKLMQLGAKPIGTVPAGEASRYPTCPRRWSGMSI